MSSLSAWVSLPSGLFFALGLLACAVWVGLALLFCFLAALYNIPSTKVTPNANKSSLYLSAHSSQIIVGIFLLIL